MNDFTLLNQRFETAAPQTILQWAVDTYQERLALVTSFQPSGLVLLHMLHELAPTLPVLTLDTGLLFPETNSLIEQWEKAFNLKVTRIRPAQTVAQQAHSHGAALWEHDADRCCNLRKTIPLGAALQGYEAWITGIRRDQSQTRRSSPVVAWDSKYANVKLAPLATWTEEMVWTYIHAHDLPYNTLHHDNYLSIGCQPCTRAVAPGEDARAGRWSRQAKIECGIHVSDSIATVA
ncbi:MAG: phosphoadenylyl-sulfate reductase [Armatimonadetes bacterium]|nr:phosphoadenylyl-sulfate reductase [Anaerolineae bacterium]